MGCRLTLATFSILRGVLRNFVIVSIVVLNLIARFRYETGVVRVLCGDLKTQRECRGE